MSPHSPREPLAELGRRARESALLWDVDGTLAPIVDDPGAAAVPAAVREQLRELARRYRLVACVSGRRADAARRLVGLPELTYAGNHGLEVLLPGEEQPRLDPTLGRRGAAAAAFSARLDWDRLETVGLRLEDKGPIQAIHWRTAPDPRTAEQRARELAELAADEGLIPHFGRMVLELRPLAEVDKGVAVRRLVDQAGARLALFAGDDRTDLDAFRGLRDLAGEGTLELAFCVGIGSEEGPPEIAAQADLVVSGDEVPDLLRRLLEGAPADSEARR